MEETMGNPIHVCESDKEVKKVLIDSIPAFLSAVIAVVFATALYPFMLGWGIISLIRSKMNFKPVFLLESWVEPFYLIFVQVTGLLSNPRKFFSKDLS
jgi:hypothetical protein